MTTFYRLRFASFSEHFCIDCRRQYCDCRSMLAVVLLRQWFIYLFIYYYARWQPDMQIYKQ